MVFLNPYAQQLRARGQIRSRASSGQNTHCQKKKRRILAIGGFPRSTDSAQIREKLTPIQLEYPKVTHVEGNGFYNSVDKFFFQTNNEDWGLLKKRQGQKSRYVNGKDVANLRTTCDKLSEERRYGATR